MCRKKKEKEMCFFPLFAAHVTYLSLVTVSLVHVLGDAAQQVGLNAAAERDKKNRGSDVMVRLLHTSGSTDCWLL